jgi:hypothetical protein
MGYAGPPGHETPQWQEEAKARQSDRGRVTCFIASASPRQPELLVMIPEPEIWTWFEGARSGLFFKAFGVGPIRK